MCNVTRGTQRRLRKMGIPLSLDKMHTFKKGIWVEVAVIRLMGIDICDYLAVWCVFLISILWPILYGLTIMSWQERNSVIHMRELRWSCCGLEC